MPEGAINGDILIYVPRKIEPEVYITIPCEYNLREARKKERGVPAASSLNSRAWEGCGLPMACWLQSPVIRAESAEAAGRETTNDSYQLWLRNQG